MDDVFLKHHGILGMKWGVRRSDTELTRARGHTESSEKEGNRTATAKSSTKPKLSDMSDEELIAKINRLELEKRYSNLTKEEQRKTASKGKAFVMDVMEKSGKNVATQFVTYAMGTSVNKLAGSEIVNPKKGQKDK